MGNLVSGSSRFRNYCFCHLLNKPTSREVYRMASCANRIPVETAASRIV